jgi:integrase
MDVEDYFPQGKRWWFRLHEKGGKLHDMPAHHKAEEFVDAYLEAANPREQKKEPIFRAAIGKTKQLSPERMTRHAALKMIQRPAKKAGILTRICCHSCRGTGINSCFGVSWCSPWCSRGAVALFEARKGLPTRTPKEGPGLAFAASGS